MNNSALEPKDCTKMYSTIFGNGNPGLVERVEDLEDTLRGDFKKDGLITLVKQIDERTKATEEYREQKEQAERDRPKKRMAWAKDYAYIINIIILLGIAIYSFIAGS